MFDSMNKRGVRAALLLHGLLVLLLGGLTLRTTVCRQPRPLVIPIEFMVATAAEASQEPETAPQPIETPPEAEPDPPPEPDPLPDPDPPPVLEPPPPRPPRTPIEVSRTRVVRTPDTPTPPRPPPLPPEEIQRLLDQGARPGTRTTVPDEDQRAMVRVRDALHAAWLQPSRAEAGATAVIVEVALSAAGVVSAPRIVQSSGSEAMDASVLRAVAATRRIPGLSAGFVQRYPQLRVEFRLR